MPVLIHSDLELINESGSILGFKYSQFERINPTRISLDDLLSQTYLYINQNPVMNESGR